MTRDEAGRKALQAYELLSEIHEARHELGRIVWTEKDAFIMARFATEDARKAARRVLSMLSVEKVPA